MLEGWDAGILAGLKVGRIRGFEDTYIHSRSLCLFCFNILFGTYLLFCLDGWSNLT